jgi:hypothetical protein
MKCSLRTVALAAIAAVAACKGGDERESARAEERMNLLTNPSLYLSTSERETTVDDEDVAAGEAQLLSIAVYNSSHFTVTDLGGDVLWVDEQERRVGSTPFSFRGSIAPNGAKRFSTGDGSMSSGKLKKAAAAAQLVFTHVRVVD